MNSEKKGKFVFFEGNINKKRKELNIYNSMREKEKKITKNQTLLSSSVVSVSESSDILLPLCESRARMRLSFRLRAIIPRKKSFLSRKNEKNGENSHLIVWKVFADEVSSLLNVFSSRFWLKFP